MAVPHVANLHGGHMCDATAELSAGHHSWSDAVQTYTVRNLALLLPPGRPDVSGRLIRLGCLFSEASRAGFLWDQFAGTGLPPTDDRTPVTAKADRGAYETIVNLKHCLYDVWVGRGVYAGGGGAGRARGRAWQSSPRSLHANRRQK